ncbi:MAG: EamA family transporter [Candidatus Portnoybacteria bacterium]|nr:EamA family transporter [Candidatus Portnoybacteria bacterium]
MSWLFIAIGAYFINAFTAVIDKSLLVRPIPDPLVYTFYVGFLSIFALILPYLSCFGSLFLPGLFVCGGLSWPGFLNFSVDIGAGLIFLASLFLLYSALKRGETSRVVPVIGCLTPVFVLLLSYLFLGERLVFWQIMAFVFLVAGGAVISVEWNAGEGGTRKKRFFRSWKMSIGAALVLSIFYVCAKVIYTHQEFVVGFVWSRMGSFLGSLLLLVFIKNRKAIFGATKNLGAPAGQPAKLRLALLAGSLLVFNKILAGAAFVILNYAISLGSATLVNAAQGVQYVFLLGLTVLLAKKRPHILEEEINWPVFGQKFLAVVLIGAGLLMLAK